MTSSTRPRASLGLALLLLPSCFSHQAPDGGSQEDVCPGPETSESVVCQQAMVVTGSLSADQARAGLAAAMDSLVSSYESARSKEPELVGEATWTFRLEADGTTRMLLEGKRSFTGGDGDALIESFALAAMGSDFVFPAADGPSMVEARFAFGGAE